jgi:hypothetical protein
MKKLAVVTCIGIGMFLSAHAVLRADSVSQIQSSSYFGNYAYDDANDTAVDSSGFVLSSDSVSCSAAMPMRSCSS